MRITKTAIIVTLVTAGYASEVAAGKFSFFTGGSKKVSRAADDAPNIDEDAVDHGAIVDGLGAVGDIGGIVYDKATDRKDRAPSGGSIPSDDEYEAAPETVDLGGGIFAERKTLLGRRMLAVHSPTGSITASAGNGPIAQEAARILNLRTLPASGGVTRDALIADGTLRPAMQSDLEAWKAAALRRSPHASTKIQRDRRDFYVLTRPLRGDELLTGGSGTAIFLPDGIPVDRAPMGARAYYTLGDGRCTGTDNGCRRFHETAAPATDTAACFPGLPHDVELHAFGTYEATPKRKSDFLVGRNKADETGQIDVYVAPTSSPVVLLLGAYDPVLWAIHRAEGAEIAAILVRGYRAQAIAGVSDVPVRFSTAKDGLAPGCGGYDSDYKATADRDVWFEEAKNIFGRGVTETDGKYYGDIFAVGAWDGLETAAPLPVALEDIRASGKVEERGLELPKGKLMILGFFAFVFRKRIMSALN